MSIHYHIVIFGLVLSFVDFNYFYICKIIHFIILHIWASKSMGSTSIIRKKKRYQLNKRVFDIDHTRKY